MEHPAALTMGYPPVRYCNAKHPEKGALCNERANLPHDVHTHYDSANKTLLAWDADRGVIFCLAKHPKTSAVCGIAASVAHRVHVARDHEGQALVVWR